MGSGSWPLGKSFRATSLETSAILMSEGHGREHYRGSSLSSGLSHASPLLRSLCHSAGEVAALFLRLKRTSDSRSNCLTRCCDVLAPDACRMRMQTIESGSLLPPAQSGCRRGLQVCLGGDAAAMRAAALLPPLLAAPRDTSTSDADASARLLHRRCEPVLGSAAGAGVAGGATAGSGWAAADADPAAAAAAEGARAREPAPFCCLAPACWSWSAPERRRRSCCRVASPGWTRLRSWLPASVAAALLPRRFGRRAWCCADPGGAGVAACCLLALAVPWAGLPDCWLLLVTCAVPSAMLSRRCGGEVPSGPPWWTAAPPWPVPAVAGVSGADRSPTEWSSPKRLAVRE